MLLILYFLLGPLLMMAAAVCADARDSAFVAGHGEPARREDALRYVFVLGLLVTFVGLFILIGSSR